MIPIEPLSQKRINFICILTTISPFIIHYLWVSLKKDYGFIYPISTALFIGILSIYKRKRIHDYLKVVNGQAQKYKTTIHVNKELKKYDEIKDIMLQISYSIVDIKNMDELLQLFVDSVVQIIDKADGASIWIKNEEDLFELKAVHGIDPSCFPKSNLTIEETPLADCSSNNCFISKIINSPKKDLIGLYGSQDELNPIKIKSRIITPILLDNKIYGFIHVDNCHHEGVFEKEDMVIMEYLTSQLSISIKNLLLFEKTLFLSRYDGLTKVYHRHFFDELFSNLFDRAKRYNEQFALCLFDLNNLKQMNDLYGHLAGDFAIKHFAQTLKDNIRESDLLGRFGGDEFILVFLNCDEKAAQKKIHLMSKTLDKTTLYHENNPLKVEFSYGISVFPYDSDDYEELFEKADMRMYENKRAQKK